MNTLLTHAALWISEGTCDDCLIKMMRLLRGKNNCEYNLYLEDSFSRFIKFQKCETINLTFGPHSQAVEMTSSPEHIRRTSVRTFGTHAFLTSPEADKRVIAQVSFTPGYPDVKLYLTTRQIVSLRTILDLHARVIRAHSWDQSVHAFNAWFAERRINLDSNVNDLLDIMINDLSEIRKINSTTHAVSSHLICLMVKGVLSREMIVAYNKRPTGERAHDFLVRFVFHVSPSTITMKHADLLFKRFLTATPEERRMEISFTLENTRHSYSLCPPQEVGELSNYIEKLRKESYKKQNMTEESQETVSISSCDENRPTCSTSQKSSSKLPELPSYLRSSGNRRNSSALSLAEASSVLEIMGMRCTSTPVFEDANISKESPPLENDEVMTTSDDSLSQVRAFLSVYPSLPSSMQQDSESEISPKSSIAGPSNDF